MIRLPTGFVNDRSIRWETHIVIVIDMDPHVVKGNDDLGSQPAALGDLGIQPAALDDLGIQPAALR